MIAAPFVGEFGWEVALWAPHLRWARRHLCPTRDFIVYCRKGHEGLYDGFASEVIEVDLPVMRPDCREGFLLEGGRFDHLKWARCNVTKFRKDAVIFPDQMVTRWNPVPTSKRTVNIPLITHNPIKGRIGVHARRCKDKQPERNWALAKWLKLMDVIDEELEIVSFGSMKDALGLGMNMRGVSIKVAAEVLSSCEFVVGPSSGALHLANWCQVPVVWWSGNAKDQPRYQKAWNPFGCRNKMVAPTWDPDVEQVAEAIAGLRG